MKPARTKPTKAAAAPARPYKVICISIYADDLARLDEMVAALKARGHTKANRSAFIRHALAHVDPDTFPMAP